MAESRHARLVSALGRERVAALAPARSDEPPLVVISPHPDDDVIGLGGFIALEAERGRPVWSVVVTDGRGSVRRPGASEGDLVASRRREAEAGLVAVGAEGAIFLGLQSAALRGEVPAGPTLDLRRVFEILGPRDVATPSPFERHATHVHATRLALAALREVPGSAPSLLGYGVWGPILGGAVRVIDITAVAELKRRAIRAHASQCDYKAWDDGALARNRSDAVFLETHAEETIRFAEVLLDMSPLLRSPDLSLRDFAVDIARRDIEERVPPA